MSTLLLGIIIGLGIAGLVVALFFGLRLPRLLQRRKEEQLLLLSSQHERLKAIVSDLLRKADEVDSSMKYARNQLDGDTTLRLAETCNDLVLLGDVTKDIEQLLKDKNISATRKALLHACELAAVDSRKLRAIKHAVRDLDRRRVDPGRSDAT